MCLLVLQLRQDVSSGGWQPSILLATFSTDQDLVAQHYNTGWITLASSVDGSQSSVLGEDADCKDPAASPVFLLHR